MISEEYKKLIEKAKALVGPKDIRGGVVKEVCCVLVNNGVIPPCGRCREFIFGLHCNPWKSSPSISI